MDDLTPDEREAFEACVRENFDPDRATAYLARDDNGTYEEWPVMLALVAFKRGMAYRAEAQPWRDAVVAALKAHGRYFEHAMDTQTPEQLLADLLRTAGAEAASPSRHRLRDLASIADQLVHCARSIAGALQPAERLDVVMADAGPAIAPDTVPVIKAWAEGAAVQSRYRCMPGISNPDEWRDCARPGEQCIPNWLHPFMEYRVKP